MADQGVLNRYVRGQGIKHLVPDAEPRGVRHHRLALQAELADYRAALFELDANNDTAARALVARHRRYLAELTAEMEAARELRRYLPVSQDGGPVPPASADQYLGAARWSGAVPAVAHRPLPYDEDGVLDVPALRDQVGEMSDHLTQLHRYNGELRDATSRTTGAYLEGSLSPSGLRDAAGAELRYLRRKCSRLAGECAAYATRAREYFYARDQRAPRLGKGEATYAQVFAIEGTPRPAGFGSSTPPGHVYACVSGMVGPAHAAVVAAKLTGACVRGARLHKKDAMWSEVPMHTRDSAEGHALSPAEVAESHRELPRGARLWLTGAPLKVKPYSEQEWDALDEPDVPEVYDGVRGPVVARDGAKALMRGLQLPEGRGAARVVEYGGHRETPVSAPLPEMRNAVLSPDGELVAGNGPNGLIFFGLSHDRKGRLAVRELKLPRHLHGYHLEGEPDFGDKGDAFVNLVHHRPRVRIRRRGDSVSEVGP